MDFDKYIKTIDCDEQVRDLEKIKEIEKLEEADKQSFEHISLISRALRRPIEIFINRSLYYTFGSNFFQGIAQAVQIEKILTLERPKWKKLTGNLYFICSYHLDSYNTFSIYCAVAEENTEKCIRELMVKVAE